MSNISLKKPFKHFDTSALFYGSKVSVNAENTSYIQNGEVHDGTPDILWENTVFIHDIAQVWNRGRYYNSQKYIGKLSTITKNSFQMYSGMSIVTLVDKNPEALDASVFQNYPGILPSIVVAPGKVTDIDQILALADKGCDVVSTALNGVSAYDSSKSKDLNYDNILENMTATEQWLVERGLFTECYKYPNSSVAAAESEFIQRYEAYGLVESATAANGVYCDNMLLNGKAVTTDAECTAAKNEISGNTDGNWLIYILDTENISSTAIGDLIEAIQDGVDAGTCIYMQINEGIKMRAPEMNVGRSENTLPFRVYKDGTVDADLSGGTLANIAGEGLTYNSATGKLDSSAAQSDWTEDDPSESSYILNKPTLGTASGKDFVTSLTGSSSLPTDEAVKSYIGSYVASTYNGLYDAMTSDDVMWKFTYFMSTYLFSYMNEHSYDFLLTDEQPEITNS